MSQKKLARRTRFNTQTLMKRKSKLTEDTDS